MERIKRRLSAWKHFFRGEATFFQTAAFMIPVQWRPGWIISTKFFEKPFLIPANEDMEGFIGLKYQIVTKNEYHLELIKKNGVVIDAGANIGVFAIAAAVRHPDATIYAFEPTPETFYALKENTKYYHNIKVFNCGLGETDRMASVITGKRSGANKIGEGGIPIEVKMIDSFDLPASFIKMDTEGYEGNILKGAAKTIAAHKPIIAMSAYHNVDDKTELPAILNRITPYDCELHNDYEEDFICKPR